ncbi:MAG: polysaccharide pyruvyl transferase family protein [Lachnospiraceae bacterium]|nr:polysaccharide pyruvyl transferase family protein [Lachnospiraceae bacterium]
MNDRDKKAVIITWCLVGLNYGTVLQAYAMQSVLKRLGISPVTVSWCSKETRKLFWSKSNVNFISWMKFQYFVSRYMGPVFQCDRREKAEAISKGCDILICGSDQIWNPKVFDGENVYTLDFGDKGVKKIAYAASMATGNLSKKNEMILDQMISSIKKIDHISVRETDSRDILSQKMENPIEVVLDPTLLISRDEWLKISCKRMKKKNYILVYALGEIKAYRAYIKKIASKYGIDQILWLNLVKYQSFEDKRVKALDPVTPQEFLGYIRDAAIVFTDSFHAVAFSVNLQKDFYVIDRRFNLRQKEKDTRIDDILERLGLEKRKVRCIQDIDHIEKVIDYAPVNIKLQSEREKSMEFLKNALFEK